MDAPMPLDPRVSASRDWRIPFGLVVSAGWIGLGLWYVSAQVGWGQFFEQPADAMGGFLEGAFAPLAFLWLVIGFFLQQRELALSTRTIHAQYEEMRRTASSAEIQSQAITDNALHQQRETVIRVAGLVDQQLSGIAGLLYLSSQGDALEAEEIGALYNQVGAGDPHVWARRFAAIYYPAGNRGESIRELFLGSPVRERHARNFAAIFERVLAMTEGCDADGVIRDALLGSPHGTLFGMIQEALGESDA